MISTCGATWRVPYKWDIQKKFIIAFGKLTKLDCGWKKKTISKAGDWWQRESLKNDCAAITADIDVSWMDRR